MAKDDIGKCTKAYRQSAAFKRASFHPPDEIWSMFADANGFVDVVHIFKALVDSLTIDQDLYGLEFYQTLKSKLTTWKCQSLWDLLNARLKCKEYRHENAPVGKNIKCIIIGAGPIGLRTAIEMSMLGCRTVVVEKRKDFSRNNVLHLWPFLLHDFRTLGAKKFYGKFGAGCIDHVNIKTLQTILLKVALVLGVEIYSGVEFKDIKEPTEEHGWRASFEPVNHGDLSKLDFDIIIGADGKKNVLPGFIQQELRGSLAIGITCNFINSNTPEETNCKEISGISYQFKPAFFDELKAKHGVELENIVYYKDETHYFVMTARKNSLVSQGVLLKDHADPALLCESANVNINRLTDYTCKAVKYCTTLTKLDFKKLANGKPDIALFDFTSLKKADSASRILERKKHKLILALVGDSLIEPFWPTGSGCGRGVLSALDVAWMVRQFALNYPPLVMLRERENVYKLLSASTHDNIQKNHAAYTIDPKTRYQSLDVKKIIKIDTLTSLYDTDDTCADMTLSSPSIQPKKYVLKKKTVDRRKSGGTSRPSGKIVAGKTKRKLERQESRNKDEKKLSIKDAKSFFEDHNKKMGMPTEAEKPKRVPRLSEEFSSAGLEGICEDIHESDDEVYIDEEPAAKKKTESLKRSSSQELLDTTKGKTVKRTASKDLTKKSLSKSFKRQKSKDIELSGPSTEEAPPNFKKKVFQAKGGGLKSKTKSESRKSSERHKSTSDKKATVKRKSRKSAGSTSEMETSRYSNVHSFTSTCSEHSKKSSRSNTSVMERRIKKRKSKSEMRRVSGGTIVKRKSLTKKPTFLENPGKSKIQAYVKLFEENCGGVTSSSFIKKTHVTSTSNSSFNSSRNTFIELSSISKEDSSNSFEHFKTNNLSQSLLANFSDTSLLPVVGKTEADNRKKSEESEKSLAYETYLENSSVENKEILNTVDTFDSVCDQNTSSSIQHKSDHGSKNNLLGLNTVDTFDSVCDQNTSSSIQHKSDHGSKNNLLGLNTVDTFDSVCDQNTSSSIQHKSDHGSKNNLLGSLSNNSMIDETRCNENTMASVELSRSFKNMDRSFDDNNLKPASNDMSLFDETRCNENTIASSELSRSFKNMDQSLDDNNHLKPPTSMIENDQITYDDDSFCELSSEPVLTDQSRELKRTPTKRSAKVRRSSSIKRSKFGKLDLSMRRKWSPCPNVDREEQEESNCPINLVEGERNDKKEVKRSVSTRAAKTKVLRTIVKSYDLRRKSNNTLIEKASDLSDNLTSLSINDNSISSKSDVSIKSDRQTRSRSKINASDSKINQKPTVNKAVAEKKTTDTIIPELSSARKTRYSHVKSSYAQNNYTPVVSRRTRLSSAKTSSNQVARSLQRSSSVSSVKTKNKDVIREHDIQIQITDESNSTQTLNLDDETATDSSGVFTINYDATHSPKLKHSRKRRNLQSASVIRKKSCKNASPSRRLVEERRKMKSHLSNVRKIDEGKYLSVSSSISSVSESDITSTTLTQSVDFSNNTSTFSDVSGENQTVNKEKTFDTSSDLTLCTSLSKNIDSSRLSITPVSNSSQSSVNESKILSNMDTNKIKGKKTPDKTSLTNNSGKEYYDTSTLITPNISLTQNVDCSNNTSTYSDDSGENQTVNKVTTFDTSSDLTLCTSLSKTIDSSRLSITTVSNSSQSSVNESKILSNMDTNKMKGMKTPENISGKKYYDTSSSITPNLSELTLCTPMSQNDDNSMSDGHVRDDSFNELSSITTVLSSVTSTSIDSQISLERSENKPPLQTIHIDTPHPENKENRMLRMQQGSRKRCRNRNVPRDVPRGRRVCPLGKSSLNKSTACGAVKNFLGNTHSQRRDYLNSIFEE